MRVTAAFSRLLDLPGVWVRKVRFEPDRVIVWVALRRKKLVCPKCSYSTMARENEQDHDSVWRAVDLGLWRLEVRARLRRLRCPVHGAHVEGVPFARDGARFTRDFEDVVAWLMTKTDRTAVCRLMRIDWETVGRIIKRVGDELLPADRLNNLFEISIDEVAWRKGHRYLTLIGDHCPGSSGPCNTLTRRSCDGGAQAKVRSGCSSGDVLAGAPVSGASPRAPAVLGRDRPGCVQRGRGRRGRGVSRGWRPVVSREWRDAHCHPGSTVGALPVIR